MRITPAASLASVHWLSANAQLPDRKTEVAGIAREMRDGIGVQFDHERLVACESIQRKWQRASGHDAFVDLTSIDLDQEFVSGDRHGPQFELQRARRYQR